VSCVVALAAFWVSVIVLSIFANTVLILLIGAAVGPYPAEWDVFDPARLLVFEDGVIFMFAAGRNFEMDKPVVLRVLYNHCIYSGAKKLREA
jgi:hypothetical protein